MMSHHIKMIIFVLHPNKAIKKILINWNKKQYKDTEKLLRDLITNPCNTPKPSKSPNILTNVDEIEEIPI